MDYITFKGLEPRSLNKRSGPEDTLLLIQLKPPCLLGAELRLLLRLLHT